MLKAPAAEVGKLPGRPVSTEGEGEVLSGHGPPPPQPPEGKIAEPAAHPELGRGRQEAEAARQEEKNPFQGPAAPPRVRGVS